MVGSQALLVIIILVPAVNVTKPGVLDIKASQVSCGPVESVTKQLTAIYCTDFESNFAKGEMIWKETRDTGMEAAVMMLDGEINLIEKQSDGFSSAAAILHGFLEASDKAYDQTVNDIVKISIALHAINLLQTLTTLYVWSSAEHFHWFQALIYKRKGYDPHLWQTHPMDWDKNLAAICTADNPILLSDLLSGII
jgi:hypothetical protein